MPKSRALDMESKLEEICKKALTEYINLSWKQSGLNQLTQSNKIDYNEENKFQIEI